MAMERKDYSFLLRWWKSPERKPLLIYGARQVGKTYLIRDIFAKRNFQKYIYIDFQADRDIRVFTKNHVKADDILRYLSLVKQVDIDGNTLIIFDEVQECMPALTALKYFCQDHPEIPVIATGSMVRIKIHASESKSLRLDPEIEEENQDGSNNCLFPLGKIDELTMHPMTFEEWLMAVNPRIYDFVRQGYENKAVFSEEEHRLILKQFYNYLFVGGMPEVASLFAKNQDYRKARATLRNIYDNYLNDMSLYQISSQAVLRTRNVFDHIYLELAKENKNFKISSIEKGKRFREYENPLSWLSLAGLILSSHQVKEHVSYPLMSEDGSLFRLYLPDCGLFALQSQIYPETFLDPAGQNTLSGIFFENFAAEELVARDYPLFYWKGKTSSELEFLLMDRGNIVPIDCKKNKGSLDSLKKYREHNANALAIKVSANQYGYDEKNKLLTLPFYYFPFYLDDITKYRY